MLLSLLMSIIVFFLYHCMLCYTCNIVCLVFLLYWITRAQDLCNDLSITIGDTVVDCSSQVKDLGVIFDRVLSLRQHVSYTSKTCRFHLRNISRIRKYIPQDTSAVLVKSLVMSRLDY